MLGLVGVAFSLLIGDGAAVAVVGLGGSVETDVYTVGADMAVFSQDEAGIDVQTLVLLLLMQMKVLIVTYTLV